MPGNSQTVDELLIKLGLDNAELLSGLAKSQASAVGAAKKIADQFNKVGDSVITSTAAIGKWGAAISAAAAGALALLAKNGFEAASAIKETADNLGMTANGFRSLSDAAEDYGITQEKLTRSLYEFNSRIAEGSKVGSETAKAFKAVGLSASELRNSLPDERILALADAVKSAGTEAERLAIAEAALGQQGGRMVKWLSQGSDAIRAQQEGFKKLHGAISEFDYRRIEEGKRAIADFGDLAATAGMAVASGFTNAIKFAYEKVSQLVEKMGGWKTVTDAVEKAVSKAAKVMGDAWQGLNIIWDAAKIVFLSFSEVVWKFIRAAVVAFDFWAKKLGQFWDFLKAGFNFAFEGIKTYLTGLKVVWMKVFAFLTDTFASFLSTVGEGLQATGVKGLTHLGRATEEASMKVRASFGTMSADAEKDWDGATDRMRAASAEFADASAKAFGDWNTDSDTSAIDEKIDKIKAAKERASTDLAGDTNMGGGTWGDQLQTEYEAFAATEDAKVQKAMETTSALAEQNQIRFDAAAVSMDNAWNAYMEDLEKRQAKAEEIIAMEQDAASVKIANEQYLATRISEIQAQQYLDERAMMNENVAMWESGWKGKMEVASGFLGQMATLMQSGNKKMFEVGKVAAIGQATIDTYTSAVAAYKSLAGIPLVGHAMGAAAAAAAVAAGMANIQKIRSTSFGAGGGAAAAPMGGAASIGNPMGAGYGEGVGSPNTGTPARQTNIGITLVGDRFSAQQVRGLVNQIQDAADDNLTLKTQVQ